MALAITTAWDVRTGGNDTNGGGFVPGSSGTDWTHQNGPQYSVTDGVTAGSTTITSATAAFGTDVVGNVMYVQGGTGSVTAGWYQIVTRTNATTVVVDRATGLTAGTGVTLHIGGAFITISQALASAVTNNRINVKSGTYTVTAALAIATGGDAAGGPLVIEGYGSTPGDLGTKPLITTSTNSVNPFELKANNVLIRNLSLSSTAGTKGDGIRTNGAAQSLFYCDHCTFDGFARGINFDNSPVWTVVGVVVTNTTIKNCNYGITSTAGAVANYCYFKSNATFAAGSAQASGASPHVYTNCVFYGNGIGMDMGFTLSGLNSAGTLFVLTGCVFSDNTYGIRTQNSTAGGVPATLLNCAFYNNATDDVWNGNTTPNNLGFPSATSYKNAYNGSSVRWIAADITLSADPFTARTSDDFSLNNVAGGGAALRFLGYGGAAGDGTGFPDVGAVQTSGSGGGGSALIVLSGMDGGMRG